MSDNRKLELKDFPALSAYIKRLGAEQLNFRTFMIKEYHGNYYSEKVLIKLSREGVISCNKEGYDPTPEESRAIEHECEGANFPKSILVSKAQLHSLKQKVIGQIYVFYKRNMGDDNIIMVQERRNFENGNKAYLPWTFYDDGQWRMMEPDGDLPFYKPENKTSALVMIHEGAKAAQAATAICESEEYHPWREELIKYEHWGIVGGALAVHRADFKELKLENPIEVVYVCDNDYVGMNALPVVSRSYGKKLMGVYFDQRWPKGFDIADPMPESFFADQKYVGPRISDLKVPATWAVEETENSTPKRKQYRVTEHFAEEWAHCVTPEIFIYYDQPHKNYSESEFNVLVRPFSNVKNTAELLVQQNRGKAISLIYSPAQKDGIISEGKGKERQRVINTHVGSTVIPIKGDYSIWEDYLSDMFPLDKDRHEVKRWMATLMVRPEIKMLYGMLLISTTQGVGKTTLGSHVLAPIIGHHNVSHPKEREIVDSGFNSWQARKRLAIVNEIYAGHSAKAYNILKDVITDDLIRVNEKYKAEYQIQNWCHVIACSNDERALKLSDEDRRWLVPLIAEKTKSPEFWSKFYNWIEKKDGLRIILYWAHEFLKTNPPVTQGEIAPETDRKKEVTESTMSHGQLLIRDKLSRLWKDHKDTNEVFIVRVNDLRDLIKEKLYNGREAPTIEKPQTIRKIASSLGFWISKTRFYCCSSTDTFVISNCHDWNETDRWDEMIKATHKVYSLNGFENEICGSGEKGHERREMIIKGKKMVSLTEL
jgi:hypothetical protein